MSYEVQAKFRFTLPEIKGFEFWGESFDGFHVVVGTRKGTAPDKAIVYFPGSSRRWQLPYKISRCLEWLCSLCFGSSSILRTSGHS